MSTPFDDVYLRLRARGSSSDKTSTTAQDADQGAESGPSDERVNAGASGESSSESGTQPVAAPGAASPADGARPDDPPAVGRRTINVADLDIDVDTMAIWDYAEAPAEPLDAAVRVTAQPGGHWLATLEWAAPADDGSVSVFRVIVGDGEAPETACDEVDGTLTVTTDTVARDATSINRPDSAIRHYEVWRYVGRTPAEAIAMPPHLYALGQVVWPPLGVRWTVDHGQVVVTWIDLDEPGLFRWGRQTPREARRHRLGPDDCHETSGAGLVDADSKPGEKYVYTIFAAANSSGDGITAWSDVPVKVQIKVPEVLVPVMDLDVQRDPDHPQVVNLSWSDPPSGRVEIYRSERAPAPDIHAVGAIEATSLGSAEIGLFEDDRVNHPVSVNDGRAVMRHLPVPEGQAEVHFTPVTVAEGIAVPGLSVSWLRLEPPRGVFLEDRVDWVLLPFEWPDGASQVLLYLTSPGGVPDPKAMAPVLTMSRREHQLVGGMQVPRSLIPPGPCSLHLVSHRRTAEAETFSVSVGLDHTFPVLVRYEVVRRQKMRGSQVLLVLSSGSTVQGVDLVLAHRPDSLPLAPTDSKIIHRFNKVRIPATSEGAPPVQINLSELLGSALPAQGYWRLLARPESNVALLDPPLDQLRL